MECSYCSYTVKSQLTFNCELWSSTFNLQLHLNFFQLFFSPRSLKTIFLVIVCAIFSHKKNFLQGGPPTPLHSGRIPSPCPPTGTRSLQTRQTGRHLLAHMQRDNVDHLHIRNAKGRSESSSAQILRLFGVGYRTTYYSATLYFS